MTDIVGMLQDGVGHLLREAGLALMSLVMEEEVRHLAGERHEQRPDRRAHRWGKEDGYCVVDGQKVPLKRTRLRTKANREQRLGSYEHKIPMPYLLTQQEVEIRATASTVVFHRGTRVAPHARSHAPHRQTTIHAHRPKAHQRHLEWTPARIVEWSAKIGPATAQVVDRILASNRHPEQGYRSCLGVIRLGNKYPHAREEGAARRAVALQVCSYRSLKAILENHLDGQAPDPAIDPQPPIDHPNLRAPDYYDSGNSPAL